MDNGCVVGVAGGSGGVGASVLVAALGVRAVTAGRTAVCVDGQRLGGGLDVTLGLEQERGLRWPDLAGVRGQVDGRELLRRLPAGDGLAVLSFDRSSDVTPTGEAVCAVLSALAAVVELVVVDLPRPDEPLFEPCTGAVDAVVLLGGSGVRQLAALSAVAPQVGRRCDEVWLALRGAGRDRQLADVTAGALDLPLVALVPDDPALEAHLLHGTPPGSSARSVVAGAADAILLQLLVAHRVGLVTATGPVWDQIRQGHPPSAGRLGEVLSEDAVRLGDEGLAAARAQLAAQVLGAGPLEPYLADPCVTDVLVNGADRRLGRPGVGPGAGAVRGGGRRRRAPARACGWRAARGRRLDDASPYVDGLAARAASGCTRCCRRWPPTAPAHQPARAAPRRAVTLDELLAARAPSTPAASRCCAPLVAPAGRLRRQRRHRQRQDHAAGRPARRWCHPDERLVVVEDVRRARGSTTRTSCGCRRGRPTSRARARSACADLVRQSLRMRPDRLVVGEVRGAEVRELLTALNTGHEGGCGTLHANTSADAVARFEALGALAGLGPAAVHAQLLSAVRVVVHVRRSAHRRYVDTVGLLARDDRGAPTVVPALSAATGGMRRDRAWTALAALLQVDDGALR